MKRVAEHDITPGDHRTTDRVYPAFISYSRRDGVVARWLHGALESYVLPRSIRAKYPAIPRRPLFPLFIDEQELAATASLPGKIREVLKNSHRLIVICSPNAAASRWVNEEIRQFKLLGNKNIFPVILAGEPNAVDDSTAVGEECFPDALRFALSPDGSVSDIPDDVPLATDLRPWSPPSSNVFQVAAYSLKNWYRRRVALLMLIAGLLGIVFDDLADRDSARRKLQGAMLAMLATVLASIGALMWNTSSRAREEASRHLYEKRHSGLVNQERAAVFATDHLHAALLEAALWDAEQQREDKDQAMDRRYRLSFYRDRMPRIAAYMQLPAKAQLVFPHIAKSLLLVADGDQAHLVDLATLSSISHIFTGAGECVASWAGWDPFNALAALLDCEGNLRILDLRTGNIGTLIDRAGSAHRIAFSSIAGRFVYQDSEDRLRIHWENGRSESIVLPDPAMIPHVISFGHNGDVFAVTSIAGGTRLALCRIDKTENVHCQPVNDWGGEQPLALLDCIFSPDGSKLACRSLQGNVTVFATNNGVRIAGPSGARAKYSYCAFSHDAHRLYLARENKLEIWKLTQSLAAFIPIEIDAPIQSCAESPDGSKIAIGTDRLLRIYNTVNWAPASPSIGIESILRIVFQDNDRFALISDKEVRIVKINDIMRAIKRMPPREEKLMRAVPCPRLSGTMAVEPTTLPGGSSINEIDVEPFIDDDSSILERVMSKMSRQARSPDGCLLGLAASVGNSLKVIDLATGAVVSRTFDAPGFDLILFSPDCSMLALATSWHYLYVVDVQTLRSEILNFRCAAAVRSIAFAPNSNEIAAGDAEGNIRLWDISKPPATIAGNVSLDGEPRSIEFSVDGKWLSALDSDSRDLHVWQTRRMSLKPMVFGVPPTSSALSSISDWYIDGARQWLWLADTVGNVAVWSLESGDLVLPIFNIDGTALYDVGLGGDGATIALRTGRGQYELSLLPIPESEIPAMRDELQLVTRQFWDNEKVRLVEMDCDRLESLARRLGVWKGLNATRGNKLGGNHNTAL